MLLLQVNFKNKIHKSLNNFYIMYISAILTYSRYRNRYHINKKRRKKKKKETGKK